LADLGFFKDFLEGVTLGTRVSEAREEHLGGRQDLDRGGAQNDIEITCHTHNNNMK